MEGDDIRLAEDFRHGLAAADVVLFGEGIVPVGVCGDDFHAEGFCADGDFLADAAEADDAEGFLGDFVAGEAEPFAVACGGGGGDDVFGDADEEAEGVFGDGGVVDAGGEEDGDFEFLGGGDVDLVEADAVFGDDFEAGEGFEEDGAGDGVVAAEEGVEIAGEFEHAGFRERATFADDFPALGFHQLVVRAGGVLVAAGGEEDAHGRDREMVGAGGIKSQKRGCAMRRFGIAEAVWCR